MLTVCDCEPLPAKQCRIYKSRPIALTAIEMIAIKRWRTRCEYDNGFDWHSSEVAFPMKDRDRLFLIMTCL
jgi:hypothetical protein